MSVAGATAPERHLARVARGGVANLVGAGFGALAGFVLVVVVTRGLSPSGAGVFFSLTALFAMVVALASLGTEAGLARFLMRLEAEGRADQVRPLLRHGLVVVLAAGALAGLLVCVGLLLSGGPSDGGAGLAWLTALALPAAVLADFCLAATRGFGRMRPTVLVDRLLRSGSQAGLAWLVLATGGGLLALTAGWLAVYPLTAAVAGLALARVTRSRTIRDPVAASGAVRGEFWRFTWPRGLTKLMQLVIQKADIVLVAVLLTPAHAALYVAATRFVALGQLATQALQQVLQPRFTAILVKEDRATLHEVYRVATAWNLVLTWPVYLVIGAAPWAYLAIFGDGYADGEAAVTVAIMAAAMLLAVASGPVDTLLLMAGRSRTSLANATAALVVDLGLCLLLVPTVGIAGAAIAWALAVLMRCSLAYVQVRRELGVTPAGRRLTLAAGATVATFAVPLLAVSAAGVRSPTVWIGLVVLLSGVYLLVLWSARRALRLDVLAHALLPRAGVRAWTGRLRRRLPGPVVAGLRRVALAWGWLTAPWRMTPGFVIVGAQRAGTTTLFRLFAEHPQTVRPTLSKGTGYFDDHYARGPRWYRAHFPLRAPARGSAVAFECSGYTMFHPHAPGRMARDLPGVKVVAVLRDPVERAYSAHAHELARGFESLPFEEACERERSRTRAEASRLEREASYISFEHRHHSYLARGEYAAQVRRLREAFGPDRVYVVEADAFFADPVTEFARLQEWLGLTVWRPASVEAWNARSRLPLSPTQAARLRAHFAPHDRALATLLGHDPIWSSR